MSLTEALNELALRQRQCKHIETMCKHETERNGMPTDTTWELWEIHSEMLRQAEKAVAALQPKKKKKA